MSNPKITTEKIEPDEAHDYPRWTLSMKRFLAGLEEFRNVIRAQKN